MNGAQLHLGINHLPVFGLFLALLLQLIAIYRNHEEWKKAALVLYVVTALGTIPVYMTGDSAEHVVRDMPDVDRGRIEAHDDWGTASLVAIETVGVASLAGLFFSARDPRSSALLFRGSLALAIAAFAIVAWTSHLGGMIHHAETRPGFVVPPRPPDAGRQRSEE